MLSGKWRPFCLGLNVLSNYHIQWWHYILTFCCPDKWRSKIIYFLMGPWDPWAMIAMGPRALDMGPIIDVLFTGNFKMRPQDAGS